MIHQGRFEAKVAVVTGAAQGIGYTVAANLAREGGKVALVDRSELIHEVREKLVYSSVATRSVNRVPYAAAKGGVNALTASLAFEYAGKGIRVVASAPGGTQAPERRNVRGPAARTDEEKAWYQQIVDQTVESTHLKRYATLDEQAAPILFLASDEASYIVGSTLPVGGGDLG